MALKVSIVTVVFNGEATIEDAIVSIRSQDYGNIEHIIIDGGSTDKTASIVNRYTQNSDIFISEPDNGLYDAMNKGIKLATGDIIATLNSDDFYADSNVVSGIVEFIEKYNVDAAYGDLVYVDQKDISKEVRFWKAGPYVSNAFLSGWVPPHPAFFCRKEIYEKFGYFNNKFKVAADFELMLRFIEKNKINVGYLPEVIVKMRTGGKANKYRGIIRGNLEIIRSFSINGLKFSPLYFFQKPLTKFKQLLYSG